jgi:myo-inositol-1(or 4)-monophosphatase
MSELIDHQRLMHFAERMGETAAEIGRGRFGQRGAWLKDDESLVTNSDHEIQDVLVGMIRASFPEHGIIAEEEDHSLLQEGRDRRFCWVIDPIDGTRNFARGVPWFSTSIAVMEHGMPVAAHVKEHIGGTCFSAVVGGGSFVNGEGSVVLNCELSEHTILAMSIGCRHRRPAATRSWMDRMVIRDTGSSALHLSLVGSGAIDAALSEDAKLWDLAGGWLLVVEAGGKCTRTDGSPLFPVLSNEEADAPMGFLAAGDKHHRALLDDLKRGCDGQV